MKTSNGRSFQLNQYLSYKPHSSVKPTCIFLILYVWPSNDALDKNIRKWILALGPHSKDRKSTMDIANIDNPKVNRDSPPLTANITSADFVENSLGPSVQYIPLGIYHTGGFYAMTPWDGLPYKQSLTLSMVYHRKFALYIHIRNALTSTWSNWWCLEYEVLSSL